MSARHRTHKLVGTDLAFFDGRVGGGAGAPRRDTDIGTPVGSEAPHDLTVRNEELDERSPLVVQPRQKVVYERFASAVARCKTERVDLGASSFE
jgi:hypothetical protein